MHFEQAGKLYAECGDRQRAHEAFVKYAVSSEKTNSMLSAGEGFAQAAIHCNDHGKCEGLLAQSLQSYQIEGRMEQGVKAWRNYCIKRLQDYHNICE